MKKVSSRAAAPSRNISQQKLTIGLDLGDRNSWYCVVDEEHQLDGSVLNTVLLCRPFGSRRAHPHTFWRYMTAGRLDIRPD
jgi:hypothetical protein